MNDLDNVVREFLVESYENLDQLDRDLVALEREPGNRERLSSIFRTIHTIKGTCGFFSFSKLESVTHVGENMLSLLRDGQLTLDADRTSALLNLVDAVRAMLAKIETTGSDGDDTYQPLIDLLTCLQEPPQAPEPSPHHDVEMPTEETVVRPNTIGEVLVREGKVTRGDLLDAVRRQMNGDPLRIGEILVEQGLVKTQDVRDAVATLQESKAAASLAETNIRVDVGLLDKLMNLVGELVLARNQILQFNANQKDPAFLRTTQRLNLITTELQEGVMKTRMQPIGNVWNRFPRIVRDLAVACGKEVRLELEGKETELDKTIIEAIKDPLTHIIRNAVDHGIETPDVRLASGKSRVGTLRMRAFHEGGQVNIEISDDGAGVNTERVRAKAVERGLISRDQADRMSDREAAQLVFLPGFSTADKITNVSGRGVGMDVVKTNIEKIGGTIDLQSVPGDGTTLKIKIPLTLAIIPALIVTSGGDRYAIPQVSLLELVRLKGEKARTGVELIHGFPVYRLRGKLLPLVYLNHELDHAAPAPASEAINIVVLQADDRQFGLVVERINDTEEIVVKPLGKIFKNIPVFAGATIRGDGKVALILDVLGIAQSAGVISEVRDRALAELQDESDDCESEKHTLLLLGMGQDRRAAIPLSMVARLEKIPVKDVEWADGQEVVQYRNRILPLIRVSKVLDVDAGDDRAETMQVVVYTSAGKSVGLVVDRILDIVHTGLRAQRSTRHNGIVGSAVVQQRVTDLLDVEGIIRAAAPAFYEPAGD
ncbi:MAG TPA: chemotaxis protein CheA [Gemmataceae bacterium]|nr:chemotaxis protein CheA [Gemmataceae bacterium]